MESILEVVVQYAYITDPILIMILVIVSTCNSIVALTIEKRLPVFLVILLALPFAFLRYLVSMKTFFKRGRFWRYSVNKSIRYLICVSCSLRLGETFRILVLIIYLFFCIIYTVTVEVFYTDEQLKGVNSEESLKTLGKILRFNEIIFWFLLAHEIVLPAIKTIVMVIIAIISHPIIRIC